MALRLLTSAEARQLDSRASALGVGGPALMEVAGAKAALVARKMLADGRGSRPGAAGSAGVLVLAGRGNNGGDGLVAARYLRNAGLEVRVYLCGGENLREEAARNLEAWRGSGGWWSSPAADGFWRDLEMDMLSRADLVVDALLGTGQSGPPRGDIGRAAALVARIGGGFRPRAGGAPLRPAVLSLDVPTGVNADTGEVHSPAVAAGATVTFGSPKVGLLLCPGCEFAGDLVVADIGLPPGPCPRPGETDRGSPAAWICAAGTAASVLAHRRRAFHKGDAGFVVAFAGSVGMTGAAALVARAAVRGGAGLVTVATPGPAQPVLAAMVTEAMTAPLQHEGGAVSALALDAALELAASADVVALGPGLRRGPGVEEFVRAFVARCAAPLVLDADGLNAFAGQAELLRQRPPGSPLVITPHPGELSRLLSAETAAIQRDRLAWARRGSAATGAVCVLKGAATVVSEPGGSCFVIPAGNPGMATGGMGDVLTGLVAALWAQNTTGRGPDAGIDVSVPACPLAWRTGAAAAFWHALAGDVAALETGGVGMTASDVIERLPRAREYVLSPREAPDQLRRSLLGVSELV